MTTMLTSFIDASELAKKKPSRKYPKHFIDQAKHLVNIGLGDAYTTQDNNWNHRKEGLIGFLPYTPIELSRHGSGFKLLPTGNTAQYKQSFHVEKRDGFVRGARLVVEKYHDVKTGELIANIVQKVCRKESHAKMLAEQMEKTGSLITFCSVCNDFDQAYFDETKKRFNRYFVETDDENTAVIIQSNGVMLKPSVVE